MFKVKAKLWPCKFTQERSQDLKKGAGLFWKSGTTVRDLDPNFSCLWIRVTKFIRNWDGFFGRNRKFRRFYRPKTDDLHKKKKKKRKKVFTEIETNFSAEIGKSHDSSGRITTTTSQLRHPNPFGGGGLFSVFQQKSASKTTKTCDFAYFTGQWGGLEYPPLPSLRYWIHLY